MNLLKSCCAALVLSSVALSAMGENVFAQTWQPVRPENDDTSPPSEWQQRVLRRRQELQWQPSQKSANPAGQDQTTGQVPTGGFYQPTASAQPAAQPSQSVQRCSYDNVSDDATPKSSQPRTGGFYQQAASPKPATRSYQTARRSAFDNVFDDAVPVEPAPTARPRTAIASHAEVGGPEVIAPGAMQFEPLASGGEVCRPGRLRPLWIVRQPVRWLRCGRRACL